MGISTDLSIATTSTSIVDAIQSSFTPVYLVQVSLFVGDLITHLWIVIHLHKILKKCIIESGHMYWYVFCFNHEIVNGVWKYCGFLWGTHFCKMIICQMNLRNHFLAWIFPPWRMLSKILKLSWSNFRYFSKIELSKGCRHLASIQS